MQWTIDDALAANPKNIRTHVILILILRGGDDSPVSVTTRVIVNHYMKHILLNFDISLFSVIPLGRKIHTSYEWYHKYA